MFGSRLLEAIVIGFCLSVCAIAGGGPSEERQNTIGQWIWSRRDATIFRANKDHHPDLKAAVFVGTVFFQESRISYRLALSPWSAGDPRAAVVIRFDDSFHSVWDRSPEDDPAMIPDADRILENFLARVEATGARPLEVQIDYDCPERFLKRWAKWLSAFSRGSLKGREVWITSLLSHMKHADYGDLFRESAAGHILQVFDTGDRFDPAVVDEIRKKLDSQKFPFRLGLGTFERVSKSGSKTTEHGAWREAIPLFKESPWYRGIWVFPAGQFWNPRNVAFGLARMKGKQ